MAYIWEKYNKDAYFTIPQKKQSYYKEVGDLHETYVQVNVFNRFTEIFYPELLIKNKDELNNLTWKYKNVESYRDIVNVIIHQLVFFDRLKGLSLEDIEMSLIYDEITEGLYGSNIQARLDKLGFDDLYIILSMMVKHFFVKRTMLDEVIRLLFGKVIIYQEDSTKKTLIYVERIRTKYNENLISIVIELFANVGLEIEVFWANEHFGLFGNDSTMVIDNISIY